MDKGCGFKLVSVLRLKYSEHEVFLSESFGINISTCIIKIVIYLAFWCIIMFG